MTDTLNVTKNEADLWSGAKENVLKNYAEESECMYIAYTREFEKYRWLGYFFTIPSIIISTVSGLLSFDQNFSNSPNGSYIIGALNIFVAIVGTIYKVLKYGDYEMQFNFLSGEHLKLYAEIQAMLSKQPCERENALEFVRKIESRRLQLMDDAPVISKDTRKKFKRKYKNQIEELPVLLKKIRKIRIYGQTVILNNINDVSSSATTITMDESSSDNEINHNENEKSQKILHDNENTIVFENEV